MNKRQLVFLLLAIGLCCVSAFAQPRLTTISFTKEGTAATKVGYGLVTIELVFNEEMNTNINPIINFGLDQNYGLTFPAQGSWQDSISWQGQASVTDIVPSTGDGEYLFRISGAQDAGGTTMDPTFSIDIDNTTLFICRTGETNFSADSLLFGITPQGVAKDLRLVVYNTSCAVLNITNFSISSPFSLVNQISEVAILENDSLVLTVRFLPTQRAQYVDSLMLRTNDRNQTDHYVYLSGTSTGPDLVTSPVDTLNFGKVRLDSSATRIVKIHNRQAPDSALSGTLNISQITTTNNTVFKADVSSLSVAPGDTQSISVVFKPQQAIDYKGFFLTLVSNDAANSPYKIYLKGNAEDETPPAQVGDLQASWSGSNGFIRTDSLFICWDNPNDPSGIASVWWKFVTSASPPSSATDTTNGGSAVPVLRNDGRYCVSLPLRGRIGTGRWNCYVWLTDGRGNSGYRNAARTVFTYDVTPPGAPTLVSQSIPGTTWFGRLALFNITIAIPPDQQRGFPDASELRWKFKSAPATANDFASRTIFNAQQKSSATVTIPFDSTALCGDDSVYFWLADSAGNSNPQNFSVARYRFDICPPSINRTGSAAPAANLGQAFRETVVITDDVKIDSVWFEYRFGGAETSVPPLRPLTRKASTDTFYVDIPKEGVTTRGIEYRVVARDSLGNQGDGPTNGLECASGAEKWYPIATRVLGDGDHRIGTDGINYQLISVPFNLDSSSVMQVLGDDLGAYNDTMWRLFDYKTENPENNRWLEGTSARNFIPGRSFFIITRKENIVIDSGPGKTVKTVCPDSIRLYEGWNLISTPFNFSVNKSLLSLANSNSPLALHSYERGWRSSEVNTMEPWRGYALYVARASNVSSSAPLWLVVQPKATSGRNNKVATHENQLASGEWMLRISAQAGKVDDKDNWLGARTFARDGFDDLELAEPPVVGKYVAISFPHEEWQQPAKHFSTDFRPAGSEDLSWEFEVATNQSHTTVNMDFAFSGEMPAFAEVFLIDEEAGVAQNLKANNRYAFRSGKNGAQKTLKVVVGSRPFAQEQAGEITLVPAEFALMQNYPNPFNPETNIRYNLPQQAKVTVAIYDQLGRRVRTLVNNAEQNAGYYSVLWNGRDDAGQQVASGLYIYKIAASGQTLARKMVLLK
jgi:hypothetical protein